MNKFAPSYQLKPTLVSFAKVVAVIPCFNTQKTIADVIYGARKYVDEVIVVDDGSTDKTAEVAKAAGATIVSHVVNRGYGEALKSCFQAAKTTGAEVLVILDGDGQHNPDEIPLLVTPILRKEAELVIGSRFLTNHNGVPLYRSFGIGLITFLWNFGSRIKVSDSQSGFRAYSKQITNNLELSEKGMGASIEILEIIRKKKPIIKEIPITCSYENNNSSFSFKALRQGINVTFSVLKIRTKNSFIREPAKVRESIKLNHIV